MYLDFAAATTENRGAFGTGNAWEVRMKLTLTLDAAPSGVRAALIEEWDGVGGPAKMAPMVRLFDTEAEAIAWGRRFARRRRLGRIYLTDNRRRGSETAAQ